MGVMPYQFEKGLFPLALEAYFNEGLDAIAPTTTANDIRTSAVNPPCVAQRLRAIWRYGLVAKHLRGPFTPDVTAKNSFVLSDFFQRPPLPNTGVQRTIAEDWFGMKGVGANPGPPWKRPDPAAWTADATLGMWNGYYGNVELIVAETLQRMLEVSLGLDHRDTFTFGASESPEDQTNQKDFESMLRQSVTRVWPIYLFLTCPKPWFEGWVTWQRHAPGAALRGQVTVFLATPGHSRPVAPSPIDLERDSETVQIERPGGAPVYDAATNGIAMRPNPYYLRGVADAGYDGPYLEPVANPVVAGGPRAQRRGADPTGSGAEQGMWVVSHENHDSAIVIKTFTEPDRPNWNPGVSDPAEAWDLPTIATYRPAKWEERADVGGSPHPSKLTGYERIVVVKPAYRDGGLPWN